MRLHEADSSVNSPRKEPWLGKVYQVNASIKIKLTANVEFSGIEVLSPMRHLPGKAYHKDIIGELGLSYLLRTGLGPKN